MSILLWHILFLFLENRQIGSEKEIEQKKSHPIVEMAPFEKYTAYFFISSKLHKEQQCICNFLADRIYPEGYSN
jgi:hypothetical protein